MLSAEPAAAEDLRSVLADDLDRQRKALTVELGEALDSRTKIYLDTRYWILLRDAQRGQASLRTHELLGRLKGAVADGQVVCPISESIVFELFKQADRQSRRETARLIDDLSLGVAVIGGPERMATEVAHLVHSHAPSSANATLHPLRHLIWTRGMGVMGLRVPVVEGVDRDIVLQVQRAWVESQWRDVTIEALVEGDQPWDPDDDDFLALTARLSEEIAAHRSGLRSFKGTYADEARGAAEIGADMAMTISADMSRAAGVTPPARGSSEWLELQRMWTALIATALCDGRPREKLRSLHALAALHAALRWNKGQKFHPNDLYDFEHAGAALTYCEAFFTERPLHDMVTARHMALDKLFGCEVIHEVGDAVRFVAGLQPRAQRVDLNP